MSGDRRAAARVFGLRAEWIAAALLRAKGYRILERNYTVNGGEIDIIALRGNVIAFVEVKARSTMDQAKDAINATKRRRMSVAAARWLAGKDWAMAKTLRGDAVFIAPGCWPRHGEAVVELRVG